MIPSNLLKGRSTDKSAKLTTGKALPDVCCGCENIGGVSVCGPPDGTVRYYDPAQGLNCTRSGPVSVRSNM